MIRGAGIVSTKMRLAKCFDDVKNDRGTIGTCSPSSVVIQAFQAGLLTREQALEELKARGEELGVYTKISVAGRDKQE